MSDALSAGLIARFAAIVGPGHALTRAEDIAGFVEERRGLFTGRTPLVLLPASVTEVSAILRLASETGTAVVPQSGNTGLVGGQTPDDSGRQIVLSLRRLDRIRELDADSATVTAEAGVILQDLRDAAEAADLFFPLSLASQGSCRLGGNLSSNAGGTGVIAYGNTRDLCLGLEVVLPTGEVLSELRKLRKDNAGYDLKNLFIGAEGTLGVITAAVMRLFPLPAGREVAWAGLASPEKALALLGEARASLGPGLTAFELMNERSLRFTLRHAANARPPLSGRHEWHALIEFSSHRSPEHARAELEELLARALEHALIEDAVISRSVAQAQALWGLREAMSESQRPEGFSIKHDVSVPVAAIPEMVARASAAVEQLVPGARIVCFGHMGDGNLHFNISQPVGADPEEFRARYGEVNRAVHDVVRSLEGSIAAEHGIGRLKRDEFAAHAPAVSLDLMRRMKRLLDPAGIMNPGKVV